MTTRTTIKELECIIKELNELLDDYDIQLMLGQRYGYKALDLYSGDGKKMKMTLITGLTTGRAWEYVRAMITGIELCQGEKI